MITISLWGNEITYDPMVVSLLEFSAYLEKRAKKTTTDYLNIGIEKGLLWFRRGIDFPALEMRRICDDVSSFITEHHILSIPNWDLFLEPHLALADEARQSIVDLNQTLINSCVNNMEDEANQAYRKSLANSEGLGFGIISSSISAHLLYAVQSAMKDAENERNAQAAANRVRENSDPVAQGNLLVQKAYFDTHEPHTLKFLTQFYAAVEEFIYAGAGYNKQTIDEYAKNARSIIERSNGFNCQNTIVQALQTSISCGEAVLATVQNDLIDDSFVSFCCEAPVLLLKNSISPIVTYLQKEKHTNLLYNRPVFSEKAQGFLHNLQKIFLVGDSKKTGFYNCILDRVYADEINTVIANLNDLCQFNNAILDAYAQTGKTFCIKESVIYNAIVLSNQLREVRTSSLLQCAGLTGQLTVDQITKHIESINKRIDNRYKKIKAAQEEREKREAAEKAMHMAEESEKRRIQCEREEIEAALRAKRNKKIIKIGVLIATVLLSVTIFITMLVIPTKEYKVAEHLLSQGHIAEAAIAFGKINNGYRDSRERAYELWNQVVRRDTVASGDNTSFAVKTDGTVMTAGLHTSQLQWNDIIALSCMREHCVALKENGRVVSTGENNYGQCDVSGWKDIVAIDTGIWHTVGLKKDGTVVAVGQNESGQCAVSEWENIIAIAAGQDFTVGLKSDGTVVVAGGNSEDWADALNWNSIVQIDVDGLRIVGLTNDHYVLRTSDNGTEQIGDITLDISAGKNLISLLEAGGMKAYYGNDAEGTGEISGWDDVIYAISGTHCTIGVKADGTAVATPIRNTKFDWDEMKDIPLSGKSEDDFGQADVGSWTDIMIPSRNTAITVSVAYRQFFALCNDFVGGYEQEFTSIEEMQEYMQEVEELSAWALNISNMLSDLLLDYKQDDSITDEQRKIITEFAANATELSEKLLESANLESDGSGTYTLHQYSDGVKECANDIIDLAKEFYDWFK